MKRPRKDGKERRVLTPDEAARLLETFDKRKPDGFLDYVVVSLTLDTGLRRGEVTGAMMADLNLDERWLQVWGKGRKQRRVPLSAQVCTLLWKWTTTVRKKRVARTDCPYLFVSRRGGPMDPNNLGARFRRAVVRAGLQRQVRFHDLRHAAATWALKAGMPKERVARMLGHSSDAVTSIYEHLDFGDVATAYEDRNPLRLLPPPRRSRGGNRSAWGAA